MNRNQIKSKGFKNWNDYKGKGLKRDEEQQVTNLPGEESHLCCHLTRQWQWHPGKTDWLSWCQILWVNFLKKWAELWLREKLRPKKISNFLTKYPSTQKPFFYPMPIFIKKYLGQNLNKICLVFEIMSQKMLQYFQVYYIVAARLAIWAFLVSTAAAADISSGK